MIHGKIVACLLAVAGVAGAAKMDYSGYKVVKTLVSDEQFHQLRDTDADIWYSVPSVASPGSAEIVLLVPPGAPMVGSNPDVVISDVEEYINTMNSNTTLPASASAYDPFYSAFQPLAETEAYIAELASRYPNLVTSFFVGKTVEGRDIEGLRINTGGSGKPVFYSLGTVHAREWLTAPTALFVMEELLKGYTAGDARMTKIVESFEFVLVPVVNKDGYAYTWSNDRFWRKNRRVNAGTSARGVDLNRNWGPASTWCTAGSSTNPSSDTYCGTSAFSEPETQAVSALMDSIDNLAMMVDYHTYGALILSPYQYSYNEPPAAYSQAVLSIGSASATAINSVHGQRFRSIQGVDLYPHSGGSIDYTYLVSSADQEKDALAYCYELRGNSFVVPVGDIIQSGEETLAGIMVGLEGALDYLN